MKPTWIIALIALTNSVTVAESPYDNHLESGRKLYYRAQSQPRDTARPLYERAIAEFDRALHYKQNPGAQYFKALCLFELERYRESRALLELVSKYKRVPRAAREAIPGLLQQIEARLARRPVKVNIVTAPDQAEVVIDGVSVGRSPVEIRKPPGAYSILIEKSGYRPLTDSLTISTTTAKKSYTLTKLISGKLTIDTRSSQGARVYIDGRPAGVAPMATSRPPGKYRVEVRKDGYKDYEEVVELKEASHIQRTVGLVPLSRTSGYRLGAYVTLGVGVAGIATAGVFHALALHDQSDANREGRPWDEAQELFDRSRTRFDVAYAMYGVGGAALAASVVLFIIDATRSTRTHVPSPSPSITVSPAHGGAHIQATLLF